MVTKKIMLAVAVIAAATSLVIGASSFDKKPDNTIAAKKVFATKYFKFIGSSASDYYNTASWQESDAPISPCGGSDLTCTVSSTTLADKSALVNYLNNPGGTPRNPQANSGDNVTYHIDSRLDE